MSSLSDRSDTSEPGAAEGSEEESPGVLSDDQPPESPSDSNDNDDTSKNMPWLKVKFQLFFSILPKKIQKHPYLKLEICSYFVFQVYKHMELLSEVLMETQICCPKNDLNNS